MAGIEDRARALAARASAGTTVRIDGAVYTLTFDRERWVYDVTTADGSHVVTFNTKKVTRARTWLREYLTS
jgi:hypothetical protein